MSSVWDMDISICFQELGHGKDVWVSGYGFEVRTRKVKSRDLNVAGRYLACRAQRGPLRVLPKAASRTPQKGPNMRHILVAE